MTLTETNLSDQGNEDLFCLLADTVATLCQSGLMRAHDAEADGKLVAVLEEVFMRRGVERLQAQAHAQSVWTAARRTLALRHEQWRLREAAARAERARVAKGEALVLLANHFDLLVGAVQEWKRSGDDDEDSRHFIMLSDASFLTPTAYPRPGPKALGAMAQRLSVRLSRRAPKPFHAESIELALLRSHEACLAADLGLSPETVRAENEAAAARYARALNEQQSAG